MFSFVKKSGSEAAPVAPTDAAATPKWRERLFKGLAKSVLYEAMNRGDHS